MPCSGDACVAVDAQRRDSCVLAAAPQPRRRRRNYKSPLERAVADHESGLHHPLAPGAEPSYAAAIDRRSVRGVLNGLSNRGSSAYDECESSAEVAEQSRSARRGMTTSAPTTT